MRSLIMMCGQRLESLLARCVPKNDLYFVGAVFEDDLARAELHGDSRAQRLRRHSVLHIPMHKGCFADTRLSHEHNLDHLAELFNRLIPPVDAGSAA